jgi:hypothetical protein
MSDFKKVVRQRVSVSRSVKGVKTYECTVEITEENDVEALISTVESMRILENLVWKLEDRYPKPKDIA